MKRLVTRCAVVGAGLMWTSFALAAQPKLAPPAQPSAGGSDRGTMAAYFEDEQKKPEPPADEKAEAPTAEEEKPAADCGCASEPACGCEQSCSCEPSCGAEDSCGNSCGCGNAVAEPSYCFCKDWGTMCCVDGLFGCSSELGDPWKLQKSLCPCYCGDVTYGGWLSMGYYTDNDPFSATDNDLLSFWDNPNELNFDQEWFYVEKLADGDNGWGWGYRADLVYGVDAQKTQAFGNSGFPNPQGYDAEWDNGKYGWALPQAYVQLANGDWDIKIGHFFTPVGYEVIPKVGNFFYSHSYTMFNAEPFTHTGVVGNYKANDKVTYTLGWTAGWDTGFDQYRDGSNFLGGATIQLADSVKYIYMCTAGDLGWRGDGYSHSNVLDFTLSSKWEYVFQTDYLDTTTNNPGVLTDALAYGVNNYLFYTINDQWKWGTRAEWFKNNFFGPTTSFYEVTTGLNYKASANLIVRPEVKWNWGNEAAFEAVNGANTFNNSLFGIDAIYTF